MADIALSPRLPARAFSTPWIFGPRTDFIVSLGGMSAGMALFLISGMFKAMGWNVLLVWLAWVVILDTPHFFASYFRTYLDKEERKQSRRLLLGSLSIFLVGPAAVLLAGALYGMGVPQFHLPWTLFTSGVSAWAYWHLTRQHYGIMRLYNRKGGEAGTAEAKHDVVLLYGALGLSFIGVIMGIPAARRRVGLGKWSPLPDDFWSSPLHTLTHLPPDQILFFAALLGVLVLVARYAVFQIGKFVRGEPVNLPKLVFLASVIFLHGFMAFSGLLPGNNVLIFTAIVTIYHDIQYFFVVWFYGKNRYGKSADAKAQYGAAGMLSKSFPLFLIVGIAAISLPVWGFGCMINRVPVCATGPQWGTATFLGDTAWILFFACLTLGFQMHHYLLDQFIWRPSRSAQLRKELKLDSALADRLA